MEHDASDSPLQRFCAAEGLYRRPATPVTLWSGRRATIGDREALYLESFFSSPLVTDAPKEALPAWSPATFCGNRRLLDSHATTTALVFDVDAHVPAAELYATLRQMTWICHAHTSASAQADALRWRIAFELSRPLEPSEHLPAWAFVAGILSAFGVAVDLVAKDASRLFYVPVQRPGGLYLARSFPGFALDVDELLQVVATQARVAVAPVYVLKPRGAAADMYERARRYAGKVPGAVSGEGGHGVTFSLALRLVRSFGLSDAQALEILSEWNRTASPPWSEEDLERKINQARAHGRLPEGFGR